MTNPKGRGNKGKTIDYRVLPREHTKVVNGVATVFKRRFYDAYFPNAQCYAEEKEMLKQHCAQANISMGEFVRLAVLEALEDEGFNIQFDHDVIIAQWINGALIPVEGEEVQE